MPSKTKGKSAAQPKQAAAAAAAAASSTAGKSAGGLPRAVFVFPLLLILAQLALQRLDLPVTMLARNMFMAPKPAPIKGQHAACSPELLAKEVTIVVTVKDACSQAPGFIKALEKIVPPSVHLIYTYPNFTSCSSIDMSEQLQWWDRATLIPLPLRVSPMQGWIDAIPKIDTPYSLLLHNDGYALDDFFACELLQALKANKAKDPSFSVAAPMLYESKADGSLAAHATQSNLRLVPNLPAKVAAAESQAFTVRHDHSPARALNRGEDYPEAAQTEFLEDHGFLIETSKIAATIDPHASYTLEYLDMIMSIRSNAWKVLFVPTARLEFRITEFSWRDIPYFMYKRSEITCHGTRDYLAAKWGADFPNTGFWTYIKYTIVEQHTYGPHKLTKLSWKDQASIAFGFFQMAGFNRYALNAPKAKKAKQAKAASEMDDFIGVLTELDAGWTPATAGLEGGRISAGRVTARKAWQAEDLKATGIANLTEILPVGGRGVVNLEADMPLEYLPFAVAEYSVPGKCFVNVPPALRPLCGLLVQHKDEAKGGGSESCSCWINLPPFKSNGWFVQAMGRLAALLKIPSRVTTYLEMFMKSGVTTTEYMDPLRKIAAAAAQTKQGIPAGEKGSLSIIACDGTGSQEAGPCEGSFKFAEDSQVLQFVGAPPSVAEVEAALR
eukprot:g1559.t1